MGLWAEFRGLVDTWIDRWEMRGRDSSKELWIFSNGQFKVHPRPQTLPALLVTLGIAASNAEAGRMLRAKGVQQREWYGEDWWATPEDFVLGAPQWIRRGKRMYGVVTYMLPIAGQPQRLWTRIMNE